MLLYDVVARRHFQYYNSGFGRSSDVTLDLPFLKNTSWLGVLVDLTTHSLLVECTTLLGSWAFKPKIPHY